MKGAIFLPSGTSGLDKNVQPYHSSQRTLSASYYSIIVYSSTETWHVSSPSRSHIRVTQLHGAQYLWQQKKKKVLLKCWRLYFAAVLDQILYLQSSIMKKMFADFITYWRKTHFPELAVEFFTWSGGVAPLMPSDPSRSPSSELTGCHCLVVSQFQSVKVCSDYSCPLGQNRSLKKKKKTMLFGSSRSDSRPSDWHLKDKVHRKKIEYQLKETVCIDK